MSNKNIITQKGTLIFDPPDVSKKHARQRSWKKVAMIVLRDDTSKFYQWLIEREYMLIQGKDSNTNWLCDPLRGPHVTIINDRIEDIEIWNNLREKYHNTDISFSYDVSNNLYTNGEHIYYKVDCITGNIIRSEGNLGKPYYPFHLTIGRVSECYHRIEHISRIKNYMLIGK